MKNNKLWSTIASIGSLLALGSGSGPVAAQEIVLEEVLVTAQRREQSLMEVPISVSTLSGERFESIFEGADDIRALANRAPGLYAESSNGRGAPRFYIRGLGNSDFDLAASQPVSIVVDEVVQENVILKGFPVFDIDRVEVLRGPQGTLFGRNTPAGIVKLETRRPSHDFDADINLSYGTYETVVASGAIGGSLVRDKLAGRIAGLYQDRDDWIDNTFTGQDEIYGGFEEKAYRAQLLWTPTDDLSLLFNYHDRDNDGSSTMFRANIINPGKDGLNSNFDREEVAFDGGGGNKQEVETNGGSVRIDWELNEAYTLTSITAFEEGDYTSRGDIDGGFGADFLPFVGPCPTVPTASCIPFDADTQDGIDGLEQFTQELRISSDAIDRTFWQAGVFWFDDEYDVLTDPGFTVVTRTHENEAWAAFAHVSYDVNERLTLTGGLRYTDDEKDMNSAAFAEEVSVSGDEWSWDLSALYDINDQVNVYGRVAKGFRAPSIQARDLAFGGAPSVADSETSTSFEAGVKADLANGRLRVNASIYYYTVDDMQLTAVGGEGNLIQLLNADEGVGHGLDIDIDWLATDNLLLTLGYSSTDTELKDDKLAVPPCGSGLCTPTDPIDANGFAQVDGNPFPNAPDYQLYFRAEYTRALGNGEFFASTDWFQQGETVAVSSIYTSVEYTTNDDFEGAARIGYRWNDGRYEVAAFGRNITDEENLKGGIDFNNNTGFVNEPRIWGVSVGASFN